MEGSNTGHLKEKQPSFPLRQLNTSVNIVHDLIYIEKLGGVMAPMDPNQDPPLDANRKFDWSGVVLVEETQKTVETRHVFQSLCYSLFNNKTSIIYKNYRDGRLVNKE